MPFRTPFRPIPISNILIKGIVSPHADNFVINIQSGPEFLSNQVNLHFNPRFKMFPVVVRNSRRNGSWGSEEKSGGNPFKRGSFFEMTIVVDHDRFRVIFYFLK